MSSQNPLEAPDFVHATAIRDIDASLKLLTFPDSFCCYTHTSVEETEAIYNELFVKQEYLMHGLSLEDCQYVFDVGANIGLFSVFAKSRNPHLTVYAFEPIDDTYQILLRNVELHGLRAVYPHNIAVGLQNDTKRTFTFYPNMAGNSTANPEMKTDQRHAMNEVFGKEKTDWFFQSMLHEANVRTMSSLIEEQGISMIDYLKIDVEGDELAVLEGISHEHVQRIRQIVVEVHNARLFRETLAFLRKAGFTVLSDTGISAFTGVQNVYARRQ